MIAMFKRIAAGFGLIGAAVRALARLLVALLALPLGTASQGSMIPIAADPVQTQGGRVAGTLLPSGVRAYLGIPFAAPPVGELRWKAPQPFRWDGIWNADRKGAECIQVLRPHNINHYFGEEPSSEDCLYLNMWVPSSATPTAKLPVIVFIYGGGYTIGSSGMANYGGENVARAGAIFVNFNYRLGALGFMAHPALTAEQGGHSGNYGIMDQTAALAWVRANIGRFGGDPDKVLVMGQSAGAGSVASQIFSPQAKGLFRAAAMLSGCNFASGGLLLGDGPTLAQAEQTGLTMQQRLGARTLADMRDVPADRILALQSESQVGAHVEGIRIGGPIIDGFVQPRPKSAMLAAGEVNRVPIIASHTSDDIDLALNPISRATNLADFRRTAGELYGKDAAGFLALFPVRNDADVPTAARRAASLAGFAASARQCAQAQRTLNEKAYLALFSRKHPYVPGVTFADQDPVTVGAYHTSDVPYWLDTLDLYNARRPTRDWTGYDRKLSAEMLAALIAMADTGIPGSASMPWPAWLPGSERLLVLGDTVQVGRLDTARLQWFAAHPAIARTPPSTPASPRD